MATSTKREYRKLGWVDDVKMRPHNMVAQLLLSGKPVKVATLIAKMEADETMGPLAYRLTTYIYDIKQEGGQIRVYKEGRSVAAYQLVNAKDFNEYGQLKGRARTQSGRLREHGFIRPTDRSQVVQLSQ